VTSVESKIIVQFGTSVESKIIVVACRLQNSERRLGTECGIPYLVCYSCGILGLPIYHFCIQNRDKTININDDSFMCLKVDPTDFRTCPKIWISPRWLPTGYRIDWPLLRYTNFEAVFLFWIHVINLSLSLSPCEAESHDPQGSRPIGIWNVHVKSPYLCYLAYNWRIVWNSGWHDYEELWFN